MDIPFFDRIGLEGVCAYISDLVLENFTDMPLAGNAGGIDSLFLKVTNSSITFALGCVYRPSTSLFDDDITLFNQISNIPNSYDKVYIFGDLNLPNVDWAISGSRSYSSSSQLLVDLLINSHLDQLITQPTRFRSNQKPAVLDLVITSDSSISNLEYLNPIGKSDHLVLMMDLQVCYTRRKRTITLERKMIDFQALNKHLGKLDWNCLLSDLSISNNWDCFKATLSDTVTQYTTSSTFK
ncbi:hypothetical protein Zmor_018643 [Zophobas morio]|uniref:Endonuclease/exonuclease/phosphatase domain-containing protein n=1 Tax=Zophobas morio TaxID=2755281 RepID=A0AA38ME20_9CUCU|nr:hypothetical protein Zmor_018643 [Zophobas morio]